MIPHFVLWRQLFLGSFVAVLSLRPETHLSSCCRDQLGFTSVLDTQHRAWWRVGFSAFVGNRVGERDRRIEKEGRETPHLLVKTQGRTKSCGDPGRTCHSARRGGEAASDIES